MAWKRRRHFRALRAGLENPPQFDEHRRGRRDVRRLNLCSRMARIALISDAWHPQFNGIVTTLVNLRAELATLGHTVRVFDPSLFPTTPCAGYPDVRLAFLCGPKLRPLLDAFAPDFVHIVTEGPVGYAARRYFRHRGYCYTTSFHSRYPEYLNLRIGFPLWVSHAYIKWFHRRSINVMVSTRSMQQELDQRGYRRLVRWSRGVDGQRFRPADKSFLTDPRPIQMYVGRVAVEKNLQAFLSLDTGGTKYVVGEGPQREELMQLYPGVRFTGYLRGELLVRYLGAADVFVFPSLTDTYGLVLLEALACGVPVAAFPVTGPRDVIQDPRVGTLDHDLHRAVLRSLELDPVACRRYALEHSWRQSAQQFVANLVPYRPGG